MAKTNTLLNYLRILLKWKWVVLLCASVGFSHGLYVASKMVKTYEAQTTLMLKEALRAVTPSIAGMLQGGTTSTTEEQLLMNIIYSRRMAQDVAEHFNFQKRYGLSEMKAMQRAYRMVKGGYTRHMIFLTVVAEEPQIALDISYFVVNNLQLINEELGLNPTKELVTILDPPELSLSVSPMGRRRTVLTEGFFGFVIGMILALSWDYCLQFRRAKIEYAEGKG